MDDKEIEEAFDNLREAEYDVNASLKPSANNNSLTCTRCFPLWIRILPPKQILTFYHDQFHLHPLSQHFLPVQHNLAVSTHLSSRVKKTTRVSLRAHLCVRQHPRHRKSQEPHRFHSALVLIRTEEAARKMSLCKFQLKVRASAVAAGNPDCAGAFTREDIQPAIPLFYEQAFAIVDSPRPAVDRGSETQYNLDAAIVAKLCLLSKEPSQNVQRPMQEVRTLAEKVVQLFSFACPWTSLDAHFDESTAAYDRRGLWGNLGMLFNHSCVPNARLAFDDDTVVLIATRLITTGEEITIDYLAHRNRFMGRTCERSNASFQRDGNSSAVARSVLQTRPHLKRSRGLVMSLKKSYLDCFRSCKQEVILLTSLPPA